VIKSRIILPVMACALILPALGIPAGAAERASPLVIGETFTIDSNILNETRRISVYLPPGYAESPSARLPVLYMPDGGMAEDFLHVAGLVQVSVGNGTMRPFLLVGIENTERRRDMTGPTENPEDKKIAPRVGGAAAFRSFIRQELMPQVKFRYRTTDETAIVGESLAGLFVVETFFSEPDLFDTYIAFDPSLWWNDQKLVDGAAERLRARSKLEKTLYFASSDEPGIVKVAQRLADVLTKNAPPSLHWHYEKMPEERHSTIYHPAALKAFRAVFKPSPGGAPPLQLEREHQQQPVERVLVGHPRARHRPGGGDEGAAAAVLEGAVEPQVELQAGLLPMEWLPAWPQEVPPSSPATRRTDVRERSEFVTKRLPGAAVIYSEGQEDAFGYRQSGDFFYLTGIEVRARRRPSRPLGL
jgi:predicted alpha/beta superfamily hydrolase